MEINIKQANYGEGVEIERVAEIFISLIFWRREGWKIPPLLPAMYVFFSSKN